MPIPECVAGLRCAGGRASCALSASVGTSPLPCGGTGGLREGVEDAADRRVVVGRRHEPGLEHRRRQRDTGVEHGVEEGRVAERVLLLHLRVVLRRGIREGDREQRSGELDAVRDAFRGERCGRRVGDRVGDPVEVLVDGGIQQLERRSSGRDGDRIPAERARLVDRAGWREQLHHVGAPRERRERKPTTHDLAERDEVGNVVVRRRGAALDAPPARRGRSESGEHLVDDEQRAVLVGDRRRAPR